MSYETLTLEQDGPIARVWLNRPERRNALNALALEEIAAAFGELQTRFDAAVIVLGGRGLSFCAGADRKDPPARLTRSAGAGPRERRYAALMGRRALEAIERVGAITIARLHGHAIGGGAALALACDLRIAARDTVFGIPEVDLGIPLSWGAAPRLAREVGAARAKELILLCDRFDGEEAARWGLGPPSGRQARHRRAHDQVAVQGLRRHHAARRRHRDGRRPARHRQRRGSQPLRLPLSPPRAGRCRPTDPSDVAKPAPMCWIRGA